jgi:hypothetical protein
MASDRIGQTWKGIRSRFQPKPEPAPFNIVS